ncbi:MAG: M48 family metallopeptidase [Clostridia bacterium]|nr:M48 family metallopeptidase [Clostridia bacterium]
MEYKVEYSKRKNISISVKGGELVVKAPYKTTDEVVCGLIKKHKRWIEHHLAAAKARVAIEGNIDEKTVKLLKEQARVELFALAEYYSLVMGVKYNAISITSAKTRFGSCSSKGRLAFSYRLMLYPYAAREYVVVHELAHLKRMDHSPEFYRIIESVLPDYRERQRLLKRI